MRTSTIVDGGRAGTDRARGAGGVALPVALALVAWWDWAFRQGGGAARAGDLAVAATVMLAARLGAAAVEAGTYGLWWRARGARLPFFRFWAVIVALSLLDRFGIALGTLAERTPALGPWLAPVAGLHLVKARVPALAGGLGAAFGGLGLLTLARLGLTAAWQARALGRGLAGPLALTTIAWLATRVALWWSVDLFRGVSPLP